MISLTPWVSISKMHRRFFSATAATAAAVVPYLNRQSQVCFESDDSKLDAPVATEHGIFNESALFDQVFKLLHGHKIVVDLVDLACTGLSGSVRDREPKPFGILSKQSVEESRFTGAGRPANDEGLRRV